MPFRASTAIVADDHELFRSALAEVLRREFGFQKVVEVEAFDDAVTQLGRYDDVAIALVDLRMPEMNGTASLRGIRDVFPAVRLVVVTASERREDIIAALAAGVHGYIPKTLRISDITAALRSVLEGRIFVPTSLAAGILPSGTNEQRETDAISKSRLVSELSPRQSDVLKLMAEGKSNKEIGRSLNLAEGTVKVHVAALLRALGARNRAGAIAVMKVRMGGRSY